MRERDEEGDELEVAEAPRAPSALDAMLETEPAAPVLRASGVTDSLVGEVVDARHPTLRGRVRVRWSDLEGQTFERWLPTLQGLPVRESDRVLMLRATNWPEYVVTGVIDGFARRPEVERSTGAQLELKRDEALRVTSAAGDPLVEVFEDERGPVVRLLSDDVDLDLKGALRVKASAIELEAREGQVRVKASDDVVVNGETIHLN